MSNLFLIATLRRIALLALALFVTGCASTFQLDNEVRSFSSLPAVPANPAYRFERLPSQQNDQQAQVEAWADPALFRAGLKRDDAAPRYSVQVAARVQRILSPWADPWDGWGGGFGVGVFGGPGPHGLSLFARMEQPWYRREASVILRELATQKVVYESHAVSDGPWTDNAAVIPAMFDAALQGFPAAPQGVRRVNIQVPAR
ncbi:MAG: DUF4136 domain-containing protein [Ramlibacter sp.]